MQFRIAAFAGFVALGLVSTGVNAAPSPDPAELAEARAIIAIMFPPATRETTFATAQDNLILPIRQSLGTVAQTDPGIKAMLDEFVAKIKVVQGPILNRHLPRLVEAMAIAYTNEFTLAELQEIHRFARSPSGTHYLTRSVSMLGDPAVVAANQAIFAESSRLSAPIQEEFRTKMRTYLLSHPELLDKMAAERSAQK